MSRENTELSHQLLAAWNRRDIDAFLALLDPEVEFIALITRMEGGDPYRGHEGMRRWWDTITGVFPDFNAEIVEIRAIDDATVARLRLRGRGAGSAAPVDQWAWSVIRWHDQKVPWWGVFPSEVEALEVAGLSE